MHLVHRLALVPALVTTIAGCSPSTPEDYTSRIANERAQKDEFLKTAADIILPADRNKYLPLSYFAIDESYAVPAQLEVAPERTRLQMPTSVGKLRSVERVGTLRFTLKGQALKLTAFDTGEAGLFVPFSDLTSGTETYQAGRYMDLTPTPTGLYNVDFNVAYHPYCYYNPTYDCPYPPVENRLSVPIRAGERLREADITVSR